MGKGEVEVPKSVLWGLLGSLLLVVIVSGSKMFVESVAADEIKAQVAPYQKASRQRFDQVEQSYARLLDEVKVADKERALIRQSLTNTEQDVTEIKRGVNENQRLLNAMMRRFSIPDPPPEGGR